MRIRLRLTMEITLAVRTTSGSSFHVIVRLSATVVELKRIIGARGDYPVARQRLIHRGRILQDAQTLDSYGAHVFQQAAGVRAEARKGGVRRLWCPQPCAVGS